MSNQNEISRNDVVLQKGKNETSSEKKVELAYKLGKNGLYAIIILTAFVVFSTFVGFSEASTVTEVISPFLTLLGTLVGTFIGVQVGSTGREEARQAAEEANKRATVFAARMDPNSFDQAVNAINSLR